MNKKSNANKVDVSVIIPLYNSYGFNKTFEAVVKSLKEQSVSLEIILCDQCIEPNKSFEEFCKRNDVVYIHTLPDIKDGEVLYNIGRVRNIGATVSTGEFLYFNDADILVHNKDYFRPLIHYSKRMNNIALIRPKMRRISTETSNDFILDFLEEKTIDFDAFNPICHVHYNKNKAKIELVAEGEYRALINNIPHACIRNEYIEPVDYDHRKTVEEHFASFDVSIHHSATFCSFDTFCKIGGFCEEYYDWGMEDTDIQWKLNGSVGVQSIDDLILESSVMHFEHKKRFENQTYRMNRESFEKRRRLGLKEVIRLDKTNVNTFMGNFLNGRFDRISNYFSDMTTITFREKM